MHSRIHKTLVSVRIKYKSEKAITRVPVEAEIEIPAEMIYRLVHTVRDELQDPESLKNWEMVAIMFTRLIQQLSFQRAANSYNGPFFGNRGFTTGQAVPLKSLDDIKKFLETAMGEALDNHKFEDIFKEDKTEPEELKKKKFKSVKIEGPEDKEEKKDD